MRKVRKTPKVRGVDMRKFNGKMSRSKKAEEAFCRRVLGR